MKQYFYKQRGRVTQSSFQVPVLYFEQVTLPHFSVQGPTGPILTFDYSFPIALLNKPLRTSKSPRHI